ncbi:oxidoreductase [Mycobacterium tuberculosis]|uniref:LLM class flavin-dependent oxidoreductase n=7 Tax=Mycobacterium TaxID=1763 RepID=UPI0004BB4DA2|nr:LLM class flavin-dependent oxidoreductase [Mycobacterium tuberculosis]CFJ63447.1 oxidoreductase [Mycobacterium tuberculosis]CLX45497.1 oxidoreductase [Mycobacterium tuberculosis]CLZ21872.1 oxidoreductase [Mycobacterium tuberculosis]
MGGARRLKLDGSIPNQLARAADAAVALERNGFDGGWTAEASHDPFLPLLLAAEHTSRLELGTNIAVAFARNPMIVANVGWDLQMNRPGMSGDSSSWKGWGHVRWFIEEVPAGAA